MVASAKTLPRPSVPDLVVPPPPRSSGSVEPPPDSGVRESVSHLPVEPALDPRLSYSIYTVAQLDSRSVEVAEAQRLAIELRSSRIPGWPEVKATYLGAMRAVLAWRRLPVPRPPLRATCGPELELAEAVTRALLRAVPWRRLAVAGAGVCACVAALLFVVITVAEMTDDVKPGKRGEASNATSALVAPTTRTAEPVVAAPKPAAPAVVAAPPVELDEPAAPPPTPKAKKKKAAPAKRYAGPERFVP